MDRLSSFRPPTETDGPLFKSDALSLIERCRKKLIDLSPPIHCREHLWSQKVLSVAFPGITIGDNRGCPPAFFPLHWSPAMANLKVETSRCWHSENENALRTAIGRRKKHGAAFGPPLQHEDACLSARLWDTK